MKRIWKMRRDSEAVSPVIATILMVAITVVLAAVLYVMVMGFGGPTTQTPTGSFTSATKINANQTKVTFGVITPETTPANIKIIIEDPTGATATYSWSESAIGWEIGSPISKIYKELNYTDLANNGVINSGDFFKIDLNSGGSSPPGVYRVTMLYVPTGSVIDDITFNWS